MRHKTDFSFPKKLFLLAISITLLIVYGIFLYTNTDEYKHNKRMDLMKEKYYEQMVRDAIYNRTLAQMILIQQRMRNSFLDTVQSTIKCPTYRDTTIIR